MRIRKGLAVLAASGAIAAGGVFVAQSASAEQCTTSISGRVGGAVCYGTPTRHYHVAVTCYDSFHDSYGTIFGPWVYSPTWSSMTCPSGWGNAVSVGIIFG